MNDKYPYSLRGTMPQASSPLAPPPGDALLRKLFDRLQTISGRLNGLVNQAECLGDYLLGAVPTSATNTGEAPVPNGVVLEAHQVTEYIFERLDALEDRLNRIARL